MDNINKHTLYLSGLIAGAIVKDEHWKIFGFKKRPKRGKLFEKFVNQSKLAKEKFLIKELSLLSTIDVVEAIKNKDITEEDKLLYIIGVLSQLFLPLSQSKIFNDDNDFIGFLRNGIRAYSNQNLTDAFSLRAKKLVDKDSVKILISGYIIATALSNKEEGLILDRNMIAQEILPLGPEEKLNFSSDKDKLKIYAEFAQEIINY